MTSEKVERVIYYHERTKHLPHQYARSAGFMDWANEPFPFRIYEGVPTIKLPLEEKDPQAGHLDMYKRANNQSMPFTIKNIGKCLELSLGISAWKSYGTNSWALRINPSSGNLHPTEAHLILPPLPESQNKGTICHYNPLYHALEVRARVEENVWNEICVTARDGFFIALSSIYWRESWKYGERAFRYCNLDVGHALAAISFSASLLGWTASAVNPLSHKELSKLLGFHKTDWKEFESEDPEILLYIQGKSAERVDWESSKQYFDSFSQLTFKGEPNKLSKDHENWSIIDEVALMTHKERSGNNHSNYDEQPFLPERKNEITAATAMRQRRSAQNFDGRTLIDKEAFFALLEKTIPRNNQAPFDIETGGINVNLLIFVHRVKELEQGIYFLDRSGGPLERIKNICKSNFLWEKNDDIPGDLSLYLLKKGNYINEATMLSCQQAIAGDSAFSLGMIANFKEVLKEAPSNYRRLFWECGIIGQVLYLEAEFAGLRGTGIGCFYDDLVHELLGIKDNSFQSLYHFTVGGPLEDKRLSTLPPYHHLKNESEKK